MLLIRVSAVLLSLLAFASDALASIPSILQSRQDQLTGSLEKVKGTIVGVTDGNGVGSGVMVSGDGVVLTASHVVEGFRRRRSQPDREVLVILPDGSEYPAKVLGKNRDADAAMLKITTPGPNAGQFAFAEMGKSAEMKQGDWCFALGHPAGFRLTRPAPVRIGRVLSVGHRTIVSDCSIVLGDSGGPLFDMDGRVIGIHSMITSLIIENRHVAIDCWHRDWKRFEAGERWGELRAYDNRLVESSFFGVGLQWKDFVAEIKRVVPDSPADTAGLKPGDTLLSIAGEKFADRLDLGTLLSQVESRKPVDVLLRRENQETKLTVVTGAQPEPEESRENRRGRPETSPEDSDRDNEIQDQLSPSRRIGPFEKRAPDQISEFESVVAPAKNSIVRISDGGLPIGLGTIMSSDGYVMTKASEMEGTINPECILPNGRRFPIEKIGSDYQFDVMLLKIAATDLVPIEWELTKSAFEGQLAIVQDSRGNPLIPTVVSVPARPLNGWDVPFLGVQMSDQTNPNGVIIEKAIPGGCARRFGIRDGDIVMSINGVAVPTREFMKTKIGEYKPGDKVVVRLMRNDKIRSLDMVLTARFSNEDAILDMYSDPELVGQFSSYVAGGFPMVLQLDADLYPKQVGGPLLNLEGKAIGLNIARADRVVTYAIPADSVRQLYEKLKSPQ